MTKDEAQADGLFTKPSTLGIFTEEARKWFLYMSDPQRDILEKT
jgi:hypothetical protein